jgi:hypothetical protein
MFQPSIQWCVIIEFVLTDSRVCKITLLLFRFFFLYDHEVLLLREYDPLLHGRGLNIKIKPTKDLIEFPPIEDCLIQLM